MNAVLPSKYPVVSVWLGALMLCTPALLNNFPFLYADTGTYLSSGFMGLPSDIRPMTYGLFVRHVSLMESLWLVVLVQALIMSWSIHTFFRAFSRQATGLRPLTAIFVLTLTTGLGEVTGMLMPDFLTAVMILGGAVLWYGQAIGRWRQVVMGVLFVLAVASHHSNAYIFFLLILMLGMLWLIRSRRLATLNWPRLALVGALALTGYFTIPVIHWAHGGGLYWSKGKSVFLTNRLNQMGLLRPFLQESCVDHDYRLCAFKDELPNDFLWDPNSPLVRTGGWAANDAEYGRMLDGFFERPRYARKFMIRTFENAVMQLFTFEGRVIFKEREEGYPFQVMSQVLPEYLPAIRRSLQYNEQWHGNVINVVQRFLVYASLLLLAYGFVFGGRDPRNPLGPILVLWLALALVANAAICGGVSMVDMRFQYRVVWLVPLLALWWLGEGELRRPLIRAFAQ